LQSSCSSSSARARFAWLSGDPINSGYAGGESNAGNLCGPNAGLRWVGGWKDKGARDKAKVRILISAFTSLIQCTDCFFASRLRRAHPLNDPAFNETALVLQHFTAWVASNVKSWADWRRLKAFRTRRAALLAAPNTVGIEPPIRQSRIANYQSALQPLGQRSEATDLTRSALVTVCCLVTLITRQLPFSARLRPCPDTERKATAGPSTSVASATSAQDDKCGWWANAGLRGAPQAI